MKSIANQYKDLKEGRMSQANFMRNLRMNMPQYITNVTSFNDAVKILKNKRILTEAYADEAPSYDYNGKKLYVDNQSGEPDEPGGTVSLYDEENNEYKGIISSIDREGMISVDPESIKPAVGGDEDGELENIIKKMEQGEEEEKGLKSGYGIYDPLEEGAEKFGGQSQDRGETGSTIQFTVTENTPEYFKIEYVITPNSKFSPKAGSKNFQRTKEEGTAKIMKGDKKESIKVQGINFYIGKNFAEKIYGGEKLEEAKKKKEAKKELHPNQIHPQELRMGIKVELEHTDDLDKAKKIALDHLAENPFYYTALKLSGIESPSAPKVKAPVEKKAKKKKEAVELVDKVNAMQKVKMPKAEVKKKLAEIRINAMQGEETNDTMKHAMQYIDSKIANPTLRALSNELELQPLRDNRAILRFGYWEELPDNAVEALRKQFNIEQDIDSDEEQSPQYVYVISSKEKPGGDLGSSLEKGASKAAQTDAFKEALESIVREVLAETFDGRDNLDAENEY